jgi:hypothetical protein
MTEAFVPLLMPFESTDLILSVPAITTVTFFKRTAAENPYNFIKERVVKLVRKNPWLSGTLSRPQGRVALSYPEDESNLRVSFALHEDPCVRSDVPYSVLFQSVAKFSVETGAKCLATKSPLFKVTVIESSPSEFAVVFSISHVIADGYTFYCLYGMLNADTEIRALQVKRDHKFKMKLDTAAAGYDTFPWIFTFGVTVNILKTLVFGSAPQVKARYIDNAAVTEEKAKIASKLENGLFVSSNDVITSWYFRSCRADVGIMAMNFRNRLDGITGRLAGNYEGLMAYQRQDFESPEYIRRSLEPPYRRNRSGALPGTLSSVFSRISVLSSWVTFYTDLTFEGAEQTLHVPCLDDKFIAFENIGIIFCPKKGSYAILNFGRSFDDLNENKFLGLPVFPTANERSSNLKPYVTTLIASVLVAIAGSLVIKWKR